MGVSLNAFVTDGDLESFVTDGGFTQRIRLRIEILESFVTDGGFTQCIRFRIENFPLNAFVTD
jgi:hypothetical protein